VTNPSLANLFQLPIPLPIAEQFETLAEGHQLRIERIISTGQTTAPGEWYDQELDEWVILLQGQAELRLGDGLRQQLKVGDYLLIPAHCRHRVEHTSTDPPCIWLAIHGNFSTPVIERGTSSNPINVRRRSKRNSCHSA
jgi:cupin 2 domain-containing protein